MNDESADSTSAPSPTWDAARDVYLEFLGMELAGHAPDFEVLCAERPELAGELRRLRQETESRNVGGPPVTGRAAPGPEERAEAINVPRMLELLSLISTPRTRAGRYRRGIELGRGSMGRIYQAWDPELARYLALKVMHGRPEGATPAAPADRVLRFLREAQITSQLDHPGIVPVHEIGLDEEGRIFFSMKLVNGRDLTSVFASVWQGDADWNLTRAVAVLHKVCEAMRYAHTKGIVHRDIKPSNVMVGRFGEVFVMDWGVAHLDASIVDDASGERTAFIRAARRWGEDDATMTDDGSIIGTAAYMPPEQAKGDLQLLGAWTDVYSVGALLYQLLARRAPYVTRDSSDSTRAVLDRLLAGPPEPLSRAAPDAPPELVSICERAMARDPHSRYEGMKELGEDLHAYLEGRVVVAHRTGVRAELRKWIQRNRVAAGVAALAILLASAAGLAFQRWREDRARLDLMQHLREPAQILEHFDYLWPVSRERIGELRAWLADAERVWSQRDRYRAELETLGERALPQNLAMPRERRARELTQYRIGRAKRTIAYFEHERTRLLAEGGRTFEGLDLSGVEDDLTTFRGRLLELEDELRRVERQDWTFAAPDDELLHERLAPTEDDLVELGGQESAESGPSPGGRIAIARNVLAAFEAAERSRSDGDRALWEDAIRRIADPDLSPQYGGLRLSPLEYLVPLGPDPRSGLWEFAHVLTGEVPRRGADGLLEIDESICVVLVLLPGGESYRGSQDFDADLVNFDPHHQPIEQPVLPIRLDPFFLSKFELTIAQWQRLTGCGLVAQTGLPPGNGDKPAAGVSWVDATAVLRCVGLTLPSEAQWEYAARAGTRTSWWTGTEESALPAVANLWDGTPEIAAERGLAHMHSAGDDGYADVAPIGRYSANPFGLHDVLGNVAELCRDQGYVEYSDRNVVIGTGENLRHVDGARVARGGCSSSDPRDARSASRRIMSRDFASPDVGVRPSLDLE